MKVDFDFGKVQIKIILKVIHKRTYQTPTKKKKIYIYIYIKFTQFPIRLIA